MLHSCARIVSRSANWLPILSRRLYSSNITPISMAFDVFGDANKTEPPLIIMHGLLGSKQNWRSISRALESKINRRIFTVDARNHGDSPHTDVHDSAHMAEDVKVFMAEQNIPKAVIVGHSMGGRTMIYFALKYPQLVDRTIIVDISPNALPANFTYTEDILRAMTNVYIPPGANSAEGRKLAEKQIRESLSSDGDVSFILMNLKQKPSGEFYWAPNVNVLLKRVSFLRNFMDQLTDFPPNNALALFICGTSSDFVKEGDFPAIKQLFPAAEMKWLNTGHLVHMEQPQLFMDAVIEFLKK